MATINILYSTINRTHHIIRYGEFFKWEVQKLPDVKVHIVEEDAHIEALIKEMGVKPDFIFFDDFTKNKLMYGLEKVACPKGVLYWDVHTTQDEFRAFVLKYKIDLIFSFYRDAFSSFFPEFIKKLRWLPNHVYLDEFRDYALPKEIDFLLMGALCDRIYPLRTKITKEMAGVNGFIHRPHPGYRNFASLEEQRHLVGIPFAQEINKSKIFFTDDSIFGYPIAKYFEVPACNTLLLASGSQELRDLGFIDKETFVEINADNYKEKAYYYLEHEKERRQIALKGYELVREKHSTAVRARQFVNYIRQFLPEKNFRRH